MILASDHTSQSPEPSDGQTTTLSTVVNKVTQINNKLSKNLNKLIKRTNSK